MTKMLFLSQAAKEKTGFWLFVRKDNLEKIFLFLILLFLPTQLGFHFWPQYAYVYGLRVDYLSPTIYFSDTILIVLLITLFVKKISWKANYLLISFFMVLLIGLLFAKNWQVGVYGTIKFLEFSLLAYYLSKRVVKISTVLFPLALGSLFEGLLAITQFLIKGSLGSVLYFLGERSFNGQTPGIANASIAGNLILRPYGTFSHPNVLAGFLIIVFTLILFGKSKLNWFYTLTLIISSLALLLTLSRPAIFLLMIMIFLKFVFVVRRKIFQAKILIPFGVIIIAVLYFVFFSSFSSRFLGASLEEVSFTQRESLANASIAMFYKYPYFGVGVNNFIVNLPLFLSQQKIILLQPVHNIYLLILSETGIIGSLYFLGFISLSFKNIFKKRNYLIGMVFVQLLFLGLFDHYFLTLQQGQLLAALILGLSFSKFKFGIE